MNDKNSLSHTTYRCKYHIGQILRELIERKPDCQLLEAEACPDHIHMLVEIAPKYSVAEFMGYLKSKSTLMIFERHANMKYKYGNRIFRCRGVLCGYGWEKQKSNCRIHQKSVRRRFCK